MSASELGKRRVSEIMHREVATLAPDEKLGLGDDVMRLGRIRHLPVVEGEQLVGMVSERDVLGVCHSRVLDFDAFANRSFLDSVDVKDVMQRDVVTVRPATTLAEAASLLVERRIGALPVAVDGKLVGLVTATDLLAEAYGLDEQAQSLESRLEAFSQWVDDELDELRAVRDALRIQIHLGKAEARDRWSELEHAFGGFEQRARRATRFAEEPLHRVEEDLRKLADDLREGYRTIRAAL
jgi:CBS domain-containing protein